MSAVKPTAPPSAAPAMEPGPSKGARLEQRVIGSFLNVGIVMGDGAEGHGLNSLVELGGTGWIDSSLVEER